MDKEKELGGTERQCIEEDWEGEFTYVGARVSSVIDYVLVNKNICNKVNRFRIEDRMDSNHWREGEEEDKGKKHKSREERKGRKEVILWNKEAIEKYKERTEALYRSEKAVKKDTIEKR